MKIAKKLLAAIVAVMIVCSLSVVAFAANEAAPDTGYVTLETTWETNSKGAIEVYVYFVDAVELTSWDFNLTYDPAIFSYMAKVDGKDAKAVGLTLNNSFSSEANGGTAGAIQYSGFFKENLWTADAFLADSGFEGDAIVNSDEFQATIFYLKVVDAAALENGTSITIDGAMKYGKGDAQITVARDYTVTKPGPEPSEPSSDPSVPSTDPSVPSTDPSVPSIDPSVPSTDPSVPTTDPLTPPSTEDPSQPIGGGNGGQGGNGGHGGQGGPNHDHPNTGDSAVLAAAAGVVLLAGAAFVVTKKRK